MGYSLVLCQVNSVEESGHLKRMGRSRAPSYEQAIPRHPHRREHMSLEPMLRKGKADARARQQGDELGLKATLRPPRVPWPPRKVDGEVETHLALPVRRIRLPDGGYPGRPRAAGQSRDPVDLHRRHEQASDLRDPRADPDSSRSAGALRRGLQTRGVRELIMIFTPPRGWRRERFESTTRRWTERN